MEVDLINDEISIRMKSYFPRVQTWPDCALGELPNYQHEQLKTKKNTEIQKEIIKQRNESISMIEKRYISNLEQFDQEGFSLAHGVPLTNQISPLNGHPRKTIES